VQKLLISIAIVFTLVFALAVAGRQAFYVETVIPAPPSAVWAVLVDTGSYGEWNPVFVSVDGAYEKGRTIVNDVAFPDGSIVAMEATILSVVPERSLRQRGGTPGLQTFDHQWILEPVEGGTRIIQKQMDAGLYVWFRDSSWIEPAYTSVNEALGPRVLSLNSAD
jgi:hypothetical protein